MKVKSIYSILIAALLLSATTIITAQVERSKDFTETWNDISHLSVVHRYGDLEVDKSSDNTIKLEARITVRANDAEDAQAMIDHFEIESSKFSDELTIETKFRTKSWNTTNNSTKIRFEDGTKVSGIKEYKIQYKLLVPDLDKLELSNKYHDIKINTNIASNVSIKQYDGNIETGNIAGRTELNMKYGKAKLGSIGDARLDIYDSEIEIARSENINITAKYSQVSVTNSESINMTSYDNECNFGDITGDLRIDDKYSEFEVNSASNLRLKMYDGKLKIATINGYYGTTKYSKIAIISTNIVDITISYDDDFRIRSSSSVVATETKYSTYEIESLQTKLIANSYDDVFNVSEIAKTFERFEIDCKYSDVVIPMSTLDGFRIDAYMKYGALNYPEPSEHVMMRETNDITQLDLRVGAGGEAVAKIKSYDSNIRLN